MGLMSSKERPAHPYPLFSTNARFKTYKLAKVTRTSVIRHWMFRWTIRKRATISPNRLLNGSASGGNILWRNLGGSRLRGVMACRQSSLAMPPVQDPSCCRWRADRGHTRSVVKTERASRKLIYCSAYCRERLALFLGLPSARLNPVS